MKPNWKAVPALVACMLLCMSTGCAGLGDFHRRPDGHGGQVIYELREGRQIDVALVHKDGSVERAPAAAGSIEMGGGGILDNAAENLAQGHHRHSRIHAWEWALSWTIIYLIILLIRLAIEEAEDD